jgi:hypothetical protein
MSGVMKRSRRRTVTGRMKRGTPMKRMASTASQLMSVSFGVTMVSFGGIGRCHGGMVHWLSWPVGRWEDDRMGWLVGCTKWDEDVRMFGYLLSILHTGAGSSGHGRRSAPLVGTA